MTDFYSVLQRAVGSLPDGSGPQRRAVYDKARKALLKQLQSFDPPLPSSEVTAQRLALEDAIRKIENEIARQIRTRRAVQGAIPTGSGTRAGATTPSAAGLRPDGPSEAELAAQRRAEAERNREQQSELLASAITDATTPPDNPPAPSMPVPVAAAPTPAPAPDDTIEDVSFEHADDEQFDEIPADGEPENVVEADVVSEPPAEADATEAPRAEKRERKSRRERRQKRERTKKVRAEKPDREPKPAKSKNGDGRAGSFVGRLVLPLVMLALLMGAAYAAYLQRDQLIAVIDRLQQPQSQPRPPLSGSGEPTVIKNADRLPSTLDGEETRSVTTTPWPPEPETPAPINIPANPVRTIEGDDRSQLAPEREPTEAEQQVAALPDAEATPVAPDAPAVEAQALPTGEDVAEIAGEGRTSAVLYEEAAQAGEPGSAASGGVTWSMVRQAVGAGDPEPVVRAEASIPERNLTASITVREYNETDLSASHLIEIELDLDDELTGGGIKSVPGVIMKQTEGSRGDALRGGAARVAKGLFWIALSQSPADVESNMTLLRDRDWIDIPILYENDRRAILTLRKGNNGFEAVDAALRAWEAG